MKLTLLLTSDVHSHIAPTDFRGHKFNAPFGLERAATCIHQEQAKAEHSLVFDDGDYLEGSPLATYVQKHNAAPTPIDQAFNQIPYDYRVVGNHEFNFGAKYAERSIKECKAPFLCSNIVNQQGKHLFGKPYAIRKIGGLKIGLIAFTTQTIPQWEMPKHIQGLKFLDVVTTAEKYVPQLQKQTDLIIAFYHGGMECDPQGKPLARAGLPCENEGYQLLKQVPGIDVLLTGHQHLEIQEHVLGKPVIQVGCKGQDVGRITLDIQNKKVVKSTVKLIPTRNYAPDAKVKAAIQPTQKKVDAWLDQPLAHVKGDLSIQNVPAARLKKCSYLQFLQKIQLHYGKADLSATSLFTDSMPGFHDPITLRQVMNNYMFPNLLTVSKITGKDLRAAIEEAAKYFDDVHDGHIGATEKNYPPFMYLMFEGVNYTINVAKPLGHRVTKLLYHDQPVQDDQKFTIALNNYDAVGGGFYHMFHADQVIFTSRMTIAELIVAYLKENQVISVHNRHNFRVIDQK